MPNHCQCLFQNLHFVLVLQWETTQQLFIRHSNHFLSRLTKMNLVVTEFVPHPRSQKLHFKEVRHSPFTPNLELHSSDVMYFFSFSAQNRRICPRAPRIQNTKMASFHRRERLAAPPPFQITKINTLLSAASSSSNVH